MNKTRAKEAAADWEADEVIAGVDKKDLEDFIDEEETESGLAPWTTAQRDRFRCYLKEAIEQRREKFKERARELEDFSKAVANETKKIAKKLDADAGEILERATELLG